MSKIVKNAYFYLLKNPYQTCLYILPCKSTIATVDECATLVSEHPLAGCHDDGTNSPFIRACVMNVDIRTSANATREISHELLKRDNMRTKKYSLKHMPYSKACELADKMFADGVNEIEFTRTSSDCEQVWTFTDHSAKRRFIHKFRSKYFDAEGSPTVVCTNEHISSEEFTHVFRINVNVVTHTDEKWAFHIIIDYVDEPNHNTDIARAHQMRWYMDNQWCDYIIIRSKA